MTLYPDTLAHRGHQGHHGYIARGTQGAYVHTFGYSVHHPHGEVPHDPHLNSGQIGGTSIITTHSTSDDFESQYHPSNWQPGPAGGATVKKLRESDDMVMVSLVFPKQDFTPELRDLIAQTADTYLREHSPEFVQRQAMQVQIHDAVKAVATHTNTSLVAIQQSVC